MGLGLRGSRASKLAARYYREWEPLIRAVLSMPKHVELLIPKPLVPPPHLVGFRKTILGMKKGARRQYRLTLWDGRSLHLREYDGYYTLHYDRSDPRRNPLAHLLFDVPKLGLPLSLLILGSIAFEVLRFLWL